MTVWSRFHLRQFLFFLGGSVVLSILSLAQKILISAPVTFQGFLIPVAYGGITGSIIGLWAGRLQERNRQLERSLVARRWMLRDLHHRVQNNLQIVSSILDLEQSQNTSSGRASRLRIDLIASIHQTLYEMDAQYEVPFDRFVRQHLSYVYGRYCGDTFNAADDPQGEALVVVPLDTAVVVAMIVNEMLAEVVEYLDCRLGSALSISCESEGGRCSVMVTLPAQIAADLPAYAVDSRRIAFRKDLIDALATQISAEVHIDWEPTLRGTIQFSLEQQRWYGEAAMPEERPLAAR